MDKNLQAKKCCDGYNALFSTCPATWQEEPRICLFSQYANFSVTLLLAKMNRGL